MQVNLRMLSKAHEESAQVCLRGRRDGSQSCRQLADVRKASHERSGGARVVEAEKKLIICAVKKPLKLSESQDGQSRVSSVRRAVSII